jgi:hypothetical protein
METRSDFLFSNPSFIEGVARIFDFGNTLNEYNGCPSGEIADGIALHMDWETVGDNIRDAMRAHVKEVQEIKK